mmetsp:Transcript_41525/g.96627  ORF Transcript_41525/g.96627 Transcript_41525/m.96627 type:complete len:515 (+) Transcript_41525:19-1563(+)
MASSWARACCAVLLSAFCGARAQGSFHVSVAKPIVGVDPEPRSDFAKVTTHEKKEHFEVGDLPEVASEVVAGLVKTFLKKEELAEGEASCLKEGSKDMAQDILLVCSHIVMLIQEVLGTREDLPELGHFASTTTTTPDQAWLKRKGLFAERRLQDLLMDTSGVIVELGLSIQKIAALGHQILHTCLEEDGLEALKLAAAHSTNMTYLGQRIIVNGMDVCSELADSVRRWNKGDRTGFGEDLGTVLRKVVLSSKQPDGLLPQALPSASDTVNITEAFLHSFFGPGLMLEFRPLRDHRFLKRFQVDLHRCFGLNSDLVRKLWASTMAVFKSEADRRQSKATHTSEKKANNELQDALTYDLMQIPAALAKCDLGDKKQQMLEDAVLGVRGIDGLKISIRSPATPTDSAVQNQLARTLASYRELPSDHGLAFGSALGHLCQELAAWIFPEKYEVNASGLRLRRDPVPLAMVVGLGFLALATAAVLGRRFGGRGQQLEVGYADTVAGAEELLSCGRAGE